MFRTLSIPTLAARRQQLKLCTFFRYVNQLSIAPIANITHRVPLFQSRHIHDLAYVCPIARTNQCTVEPLITDSLNSGHLPLADNGFCTN